MHLRRTLTPSQLSLGATMNRAVNLILTELLDNSLGAIVMLLTATIGTSWPRSKGFLVLVSTHVVEFGSRWIIVILMESQRVMKLIIIDDPRIQFSCSMIDRKLVRSVYLGQGTLRQRIIFLMTSSLVLRIVSHCIIEIWTGNTPLKVSVLSDGPPRLRHACGFFLLVRGTPVYNVLASEVIDSVLRYPFFFINVCSGCKFELLVLRIVLVSRLTELYNAVCHVNLWSSKRLSRSKRTIELHYSYYF